MRLAVDHAVRPVGDGGELVQQRGVYPAAVASVGPQSRPHCGQELAVGDVLLLGSHHAAGDLEAQLGPQAGGQRVDDAVVLAREQRVQRGQRRVLVGPDIAGDGRVLGMADELPVDHHRRSGARVAARGGPGEVAVGEQQVGTAVGEVAVVGPLAQPVQPLRRAPVDRPPVDVGANRVDLLARVRWAGAGAGGHGVARDRDLAQVVAKALQWIGRAERDRCVLAAALRQTEGVIHELAPRPHQLADVALGEHVHAQRVERAVAGVARVRSRDHRPGAIGVVGRREARIRRAGRPPGGVRAVVCAPVQAAQLEGQGPRRRGAPPRARGRGRGRGHDGRQGGE